MPTNDKPFWYRLKKANASTVAKLLQRKMLNTLKHASDKERENSIKKPVRKRVRGHVFDDDGTDD